MTVSMSPTETLSYIKETTGVSVGDWTLRQWTQHGVGPRKRKLPVRWVGSRRRFDPGAVDQFLAAVDRDHKDRMTAGGEVAATS